MIESEQKSEHVERQALLSLHANCPADIRDRLGLFMEEIEDALVVGATHDPSILLNRTLGLGTRAPIRQENIQRIDQVYLERGVGRYFLHVYADDLPDGPETFGGTRLVPARGWMKFHRDDAEPPEGDTDLVIRRVGPGKAVDFGRIVASAFGLTEAAGPLLAGLAHDPRWYLFVSYDGDNAAGAGGMMVVDDAAWVEWGATEVEYRRRGSQGAIMRARIEAARAAGCTVMFTETGEASGDDPQHSYGNIQRYGFSETVLRQNWAPV